MQALHNVTTLTRATTVSAFQTLSYISEGCIFIYLGLDTLDPIKWQVRRFNSGHSVHSHGNVSTSAGVWWVAAKLVLLHEDMM